MVPILVEMPDTRMPNNWYQLLARTTMTSGTQQTQAPSKKYWRHFPYKHPPARAPPINLHLLLRRYLQSTCTYSSGGTSNSPAPTPPEVPPINLHLTHSESRICARETRGYNPGRDASAGQVAGKVGGQVAGKVGGQVGGQVWRSGRRSGM